MIIEDAHWIDPTTLELLDLIIGSAEDTRLMVITSANFSSDPPIFSASATAASLPEATIATLIAWRTVIVSPVSSRTGPAGPKRRAPKP